MKLGAKLYSPAPKFKYTGQPFKAELSGFSRNGGSSDRV